ncbi:serine hydrolase domain-containing protein [Peribacillus psychrosaccharolyticus]|uniref:serine hydrolase domain-containing protein n=1 Tax=Peribacillus psychrosaccharolyticus TaxID=1407 RepID=UPI003D26772B
MNERMKYYHVTGLSLAVIDNGQISTSASYGLLETGTNRQVNHRSLFNACSISKFLTSVLAMTLIEQGILALDEDVNVRLSSWEIPDNERTKNNKVTLRHLLSHQSGLIDPKGSFPELTSINAPSMVELLEGRTSYCTEPIEVQVEPGSEFHYSDAGFCIIQQLIEDVTGKPFNVVMKERIFSPLRMNQSTFNLPLERENISCGHNKNGEVVEGKFPIYPYPAAAGLLSTPSDLALLIIELMNSVQGKSRIGLSSSKAKEMITSQGKTWTGLGLFLNSYTDQEIEISSLGWGVGSQCMMAAFPSLKTGLVIMTNTDIEIHQLQGIIGEIYRSFTKSRK